MKRALLTIVLSFSVLFLVQAQGFAQSADKTYVRIGGGGSSFHGAGDIFVLTGLGSEIPVPASRIPAWSAAVGRQWQLAAGGFYAGVEAAVGNSGCVFDSDRCDNPVSDADAFLLRYDFTHLQLMPMVGETARLNEHIDFDIHVGLYGSCNLTGTLTQRFGTDSENTREPLDMQTFRRLDAGLAGGFGFWFNDRINFDCLYQFGLVKRSDLMGKTSTCLLRLGYAF